MYLYKINFISVTILLCVISKSSGNAFKTLIDFEKTLENFINNMTKIELKLFMGIQFKYWSQTLNNQDPPYIDIDFHNVKPLLEIWTRGKPVKVITHGWLASDKIPDGVFMIKDAYVETTTFNVITMDWSEISLKINYVEVANTSLNVGKYLGYFLANLVTHKIVEPYQIDLIGHSIGAHVAGEAGSSFQTVMNQQVNHITGLDPSRPTFDGPSCISWNKCRALDSSDAKFVDVIHTAGGVLGIPDALGHADFYPNNGVAPQPHCNLPGFRTTCSHYSAYLYYKESIMNPNSFKSMECSSMKDYTDGKCDDNVTNYMGNDVNFRHHGKFFLITNSDEPYSVKVPRSLQPLVSQRSQSPSPRSPSPRLPSPRSPSSRSPSSRLPSSQS